MGLMLCIIVSKKYNIFVGLVEKGRGFNVLNFYVGSRGIILLQSRNPAGLKKCGIPSTVDTC